MKKQGLSLVNSPIEEKQLLTILQRTPTQHIYRRPGKGGGQFEYVTGVYVKKVLNYVFGFMWDFEVKSHGREGNQVWVLGRLTIKNQEGISIIVKEQFGRADIKLKRGTEEPLDYGNDLKAASTDALKKCASELGIASDIYGKNEFKEIQGVDKGFKEEDAKEQFINKKVNELKDMLVGKLDGEKLKNLFERTEIILKDFNITEKHASALITELLNKEIK